MYLKMSGSGFRIVSTFSQLLNNDSNELWLSNKKEIKFDKWDTKAKNCVVDSEVSVLFSWKKVSYYHVRIQKWKKKLKSWEVTEIFIPFEKLEI